MKLQQLRALCVLVDHDLSLSRAADVLCATQPAISKQIRQLEDDLGVTLLQRSRNRVLGLTDIGGLVLASARAALSATEDIERLVSDHKARVDGRLTIATTHTHARYALQAIVHRFSKARPEISVHFLVALPADIPSVVAAGKADIGISTWSGEPPGGVIAMPCYPLNMVLVGEANHPIFMKDDIELADIAAHPLVTYGDHHVVVQRLRARMEGAGFTLRTAVCSADVEVLRHYAGMGVGLGMIPAVAFDPKRDAGMAARSIDHVFEVPVVHAFARKGAYWPRHIFDFVEHINPELTRAAVQDMLLGTGERSV